MIALSRHVLVLLEAEVTGLRNAHALRAAVTNIAGKDRVFTLLNRADRDGGLPMATIVKALGGKTGHGHPRPRQGDDASN